MGAKFDLIGYNLKKMKVFHQTKVISDALRKVKQNPATICDLEKEDKSFVGCTTDFQIFYLSGN